jgi:hypothetical protein
VLPVDADTALLCFAILSAALSRKAGQVSFMIRVPVISMIL